MSAFFLLSLLCGVSGVNSLKAVQMSASFGFDGAVYAKDGEMPDLPTNKKVIEISGSGSGVTPQRPTSYSLADRDDDSLAMLKEVCKHPKPTPEAKWSALKAMALALNSLDAPYNIHGGTVLGLVRGCHIFDVDLDFAVEREWLKSNVHKLTSAVVAGGFLHHDHEFGDLDKAGYETRFRSASLLQQEQDSEVRRSNLEAVIYSHLSGNLSNINLLHRDGIPIDLFTILRKPDHYEWGLWLASPGSKTQDMYCPCEAKSTHTGVFSWNGVDVKVPLPLKDTLVSLYGANYITPATWTWNVEPFTVGSCRKP